MPDLKLDQPKKPNKKDENKDLSEIPMDLVYTENNQQIDYPEFSSFCYENCSEFSVVDNVCFEVIEIPDMGINTNENTGDQAVCQILTDRNTSNSNQNPTNVTSMEESVVLEPTNSTYLENESENPMNEVAADPVSDESDVDFSLVPYSDHSDSDVSVEYPEKKQNQKQEVPG